MNQSSSQKGFFGSLFDVSFNNFVTTQIISVLYILSIIFVGILVLFGIGGGIIKLFSDFWGGFFMIVFTPLMALIYLIFVRIGLELVIVIFKIADNSKVVAETQERIASRTGEN